MSDARCETVRKTWLRSARWIGLVAAIVTVLPTPVLAQEAGSNGIRFGRARVHPFFDFFSYYQSNPGRRTNGGVSDLMLKIRPGFNLDYPGRSYEIYSSGNVEYRHFMGLNAVENSSSDTTKLSAVMGGLSVDGKFLKTSSFPLSMKVDINRIDTPANQSQSKTLGKNAASMTLGSQWAPGGGALKLGLSYKPSLAIYDGNENGSDNDNLNTLNQDTSFQAQWRFLPKTATFIEASYRNYGYLNPEKGFSSTLGQTPNGETGTDTSTADSAQQSFNVTVPISSAYWGLSGQITPRLSTIMKFGYGQTMTENVDDSQQSSGFLTQVDIKYKSSETIKYSGGYARSLAGAVLFQHRTTDRIYLKGQTTLARRYALALNLEYDMIGYGDPVVTAANGGRNDTIVRAEAVASVKITNWFVASLVNKFETLSAKGADGQNWELVSGSGTPSYKYNDTFLRLSVRY
uniref:Uncharacterized protein n=1 Tax=uncultured myxobacterium HF0130_06F04 TaxID=723555 RepID=E7C2H2_9BACT|nr:hypothetical protein [uncultured myxobacterium HF0130_06F04]